MPSNMKYNPGADVCRPVALLSRSLSTAIRTSSNSCVESWDDDAPKLRNRKQITPREKAKVSVPD